MVFYANCVTEILIISGFFMCVHRRRTNLNNFNLFADSLPLCSKKLHEKVCVVFCYIVQWELFRDTFQLNRYKNVSQWDPAFDYAGTIFVI